MCCGEERGGSKSHIYTHQSTKDAHRRLVSFFLDSSNAQIFYISECEMIIVMLLLLLSSSRRRRTYALVGCQLSVL